MLIRNAEIWGHGLGDLRIESGRIVAIMPPHAGEKDGLDARGGMLLPGLHDHHIHLAGLAARDASVWCGPPDVTDAEQLAQRLRRPGSGWLRGIGYHEGVMGLPDAAALDAIQSDRPLRIQHRSGRMWLLNSLALQELLARAEPPQGLEHRNGRFTGRLFDADSWLRTALSSEPPDLHAISATLAGFGITGVTDMSPSNDGVMAEHISRQMNKGHLHQHCWLAGELALSRSAPGPWRLGPAKLHLHEADLPDFDRATDFVGQAHRSGRPVAIHCVSEVELVFALATLEEAGAIPGDRIEHASVAAADLVARIASLGLGVCVQPHFIAERGDSYLADVEARHHGDLYRLRSLSDHGIALAGGSDAPFGGVDPWAAMAAAVSRRTRAGRTIGGDEKLSPEEALKLYLADPAELRCQRHIAVGEPADLCLLDRPWAKARERLCADDVRATIVSGRLIHHRVDKPPA